MAHTNDPSRRADRLDEEHDEIRIQRIKKRPKKGPTSVTESDDDPTGPAPEAEEEEQGPGKFRQFLQKLGPALSQIQFAERGAKSSPGSSLGAVLRGIGGGATGFTRGRAAIEQDRNARAIASIRQSPAFKEGVKNVREGKPVSGEQQTALELGLQGPEATFKKPTALGTEEEAAGARVQSGVDLSAADTEAFAAKERDDLFRSRVLEEVQLPGVAIEQEKAAAATSSVKAELTRTEIALQQAKTATIAARTVEARSALLDDQNQLARAVAAQQNMGTFINTGKTPEERQQIGNNILDFNMQFFGAGASDIFEPGREADLAQVLALPRNITAMYFWLLSWTIRQCFGREE